MHLPSLLPMLAAAEEAEHPVIDLDGTALVQFAIFLVCYLVLSRLFFRPYLELQQARSAGIDGARDEAHKMQAQAAEMVKDYEARILAARSKAEEERGRARAAGQDREREIRDEARAVITAKVQAHRQQLESELVSAKARLQAEAEPMGRQIAAKILGREV